MKFKAKETSKMDDNHVWIIKNKVYDLKENVCKSGYTFKSEICDGHIVTKNELYKWFEKVEEVKKPRICEILGGRGRRRICD